MSHDILLDTVLDAVAARHGIDLSYTEFDWSCERYTNSGAMMPAA